MITEKDDASVETLLHPCEYQTLVVLSDVSLFTCKLTSSWILLVSLHNLARDLLKVTFPILLFWLGVTENKLCEIPGNLIRRAVMLSLIILVALKCRSQKSPHVLVSCIVVNSHQIFNIGHFLSLFSLIEVISKRFAEVWSQALQTECECYKLHRNAPVAHVYSLRACYLLGQSWPQHLTAETFTLQKILWPQHVEIFWVAALRTEIQCIICSNHYLFPPPPP